MKEELIEVLLLAGCFALLTAITAVALYPLFVRSP